MLLHAIAILAAAVAQGGERAADAAASTGTVIEVAASDYGPILFDGERQAVYLFGKEGSPRSECYDECAAAWPPVLTRGAPRVGEGARARLLDTTERADGTTQVTYAGHPLYYYVGDAPGQVLCNDVEEFGGLWLVLGANGEPVS